MVSPVITVPAAPRAGRGEGPGAVLFPQVAVPGLLGRYHGESAARGRGGGASRQCRLRSPRAPSPRSAGPGAGPGAGGERSRRGRARGRPQPGVCTPSRARGRAQQRLCPRPAEPRQKAPSCSAWQRAGLPRAARLGNEGTAKGTPPASPPVCCGALGAAGPPPTSRLCPHRQGWRSHCGLWEVPGQGAVIAAPPAPR